LHGVSYGTVPASLYATDYPERTRSVVLEGTFGTVENTHDMKYKAEKMNLVISELSPARRVGFDKLMNEETIDKYFVRMVFLQLFYSDGGLRRMLNFLNSIINVNGEIDRGRLALIRQSSQDNDRQNKYVQKPGDVDSNILGIIYCKNLNKRKKKSFGLSYSSARGFFAVLESGSDSDKECNDLGVRKQDEEPYELKSIRTTVPVYYFQGSHDGATMAKGAFEHWQSFARGKSYFMLAEKGGHNPNLDRLERENSSLVAAYQKALFAKSLNADDISENDISTINGVLGFNEKWKLYLDPVAAWPLFQKELESFARNIGWMGVAN
jgi:proline iminopeptidase